MREMNREQFNRKYLETHKGLLATSLLKEKMGGKDLKKFHQEKKEIEAKKAEERLDTLSEFLTDAVAVRKVEVLNKEDLPMKDLLAMTIRSHPQRAKIENTGNVNFTFADMVARSSITLNKVDDVEVEDAEV